jgi:hypothetical protein
MFVLAQAVAAADAGLPADFTSWGQLTAQGVMLALFVWLITKGIPTLVAEFRQESATSRAWHEKQVEKLYEQAEKREQVFERCVDKFVEARHGKGGQ